ncbi:hypothetical protein C8F04DRAFT_114080 [Mycena alexandri]|uniref:Uncharacterized protein n=1 Tax=Mycena alexandri TaxID=1745969 RepID=A0AAD6X9V3_9AGAR|nr:hypothetical protein C8F04DRAFT_114080 [Mycena alexandri]
MAPAKPATTSPPRTPQAGDKRTVSELSPWSDAESPAQDNRLPGPLRRSPSPSESQPQRPSRPARKATKSNANSSVHDSIGVPPTVSNASEDDDEYMDIPEEGLQSEQDERLIESEEEEDDKVTDPDFTPGVDDTGKGRRVASEKAAQKPEKSPKKRVPHSASIIPQAKRLATALDPHHGTCVLTGMEEPMVSRQWAHVSARSTKAYILTALEWHWGMIFWSLYIDTKFNLFPLMVHWHIPLDAGWWALVPHYKTITKVYTWVQKRYRQKTKGPKDHISALWEVRKKTVDQTPQIRVYQYFLLPLNDGLRKVPLYRLNEGQEFDPAVQNETRHVFPFKTVGALRSHVQPHFAIFAAGAKLAKTRRQKEQAGEDMTEWQELLASNAFFGSEPGDDEETVKEITEKALREIELIYGFWTDHEFVPEEGHKWRKRK